MSKFDSKLFYMEAKTVLITGMSGIQIEKSLNKFITDFKDFRTRHQARKPIIIKFDTIVEEVYYEKNPESPRSHQTWRDIILQQSYPKLEELWNDAFEKIVLLIEEIRTSNSNQTIFINLHSCYYHNRTQEYLSLININKLLRIKPTYIITFIDDIYEIHHRLTLTGGIYHDEANATNTQMILRLLRLLDWRAKETMLSKFIAKNLEIDFYLFAVKHSFDTFSNLVYEDYKKVYLSHPITEVRRMENRGKDSEVEKIMNEITEISDRLSATFTTFLPTTIDEFRIKTKPSRNGFSKDYYALLTKRWETELYDKPKDLLYWNSGFKDVNQLWHENEEEITRFDEQINHLLETLSDSISDQVTIRDYSLVEQSDMLVIYRPVFNGNASGGVREEFKYYKRIVKDTSRDNLCFIYCPEEDMKQFYVRQFELKVRTEIEEEGTLQCKASPFKNISTDEREQLLKSIDDNLLILDTFDKVLDNHKIEITIRKEKSPLGSDKIKDFKDRFAIQLMKAFETIDIYKTDVTYFEKDEMSVEQFFTNILNKLQ